MLSIFIWFMLDLCVADQIFSCCNQTCLVKGCQGKTDAPIPCLPLPSVAQAPLLPQAVLAAWQPRAGGEPWPCATCGTVSPDRLGWKVCFPSERDISPAPSPHCWGGWDVTAVSRRPECSASLCSTEAWDREKSHLCITSVQILLPKHVLVLLFWLCSFQVDLAQTIFHFIIFFFFFLWATGVV